MSKGLILGFKTDDITVKRFSKGKLVKGVFKEGAKTESTIIGAVVPISGQELLRLSEGQRTREGIKVYTDEPLFTAEDGKSPDIICLRGKEYQVQDVKSWLYSDLPYYRSLAIRIEANASDRKVK
jgi:hypothetical protein